MERQDNMARSGLPSFVIVTKRAKIIIVGSDFSEVQQKSIHARSDEGSSIASSITSGTYAAWHRPSERSVVSELRR